MLYPLKFKPLLVERVWGGNALARYGKSVSPGQRIGESWEISDRDDAQSVVANGNFAGQTLRQLIKTLGSQLLGRNCGDAKRFPLLIKMLDARERLSLQVHPPAAIAPRLGGEPKTEMWYILDATPDAHLIAGLKRSATREQFERQPAAYAHRFPVQTGDAIFIPSGRVHAIDAGLVIVEIQQNSDTTYRVYDWGRVGRQLHITESLASIDFNDFEPSLSPLPVECEHFRVEKLEVTGALAGNCDGSSFHVIACIAGNLTVGTEHLRTGDFALLPAALGPYTLTGNGAGLRATVPHSR
jgi:mannose-6-phosphate isomerase